MHQSFGCSTRRGKSHSLQWDVMEDRLLPSGLVSSSEPPAEVSVVMLSMASEPADSPSTAVQDNVDPNVVAISLTTAVQGNVSPGLPVVGPPATTVQGDFSLGRVPDSNGSNAPALPVIEAVTGLPSPVGVVAADTSINETNAIVQASPAKTKRARIELVSRGAFALEQSDEVMPAPAKRDATASIAESDLICYAESRGDDPAVDAQDSAQLAADSNLVAMGGSAPGRSVKMSAGVTRIGCEFPTFHYFANARDGSSASTAAESSRSTVIPRANLSISKLPSSALPAARQAGAFYDFMPFDRASLEQFGDRLLSPFVETEPGLASGTGTSGQSTLWIVATAVIVADAVVHGYRRRAADEEPNADADLYSPGVPMRPGHPAWEAY